MVEFGVILVGEGHGDSGVKSMGFIKGWVATLTFLGLPSFAPDSINYLNYVSTDTLVIEASSKMSTTVASNYSSSFVSSWRISLCFPFPCAWVPWFFLDVDIYLAILFRFSFFIAYLGLSAWISSSVYPLPSSYCYWVGTMVFCPFGTMVCCSVGTFSI